MLIVVFWMMRGPPRSIRDLGSVDVGMLDSASPMTRRAVNTLNRPGGTGFRASSPGGCSQEATKAGLRMTALPAQGRADFWVYWMSG